MKKVTLALAVLITIGSAFGQESESTNNTKHSISISIGVASPRGDFSDTDINNENSGLAKSGLALGLDYQYNFHPNVGATFMIRSLAYQYDVDAVLDEIQSPSYNVSNTFESDPYGVGFIGVGIIGEIGSDVVKAYLNPFIGTSSFIYPEQTYKGEGVSIRTQTDIESTSATNLMYGAAFGAKFRLSELISLSLNFEYAKAPDYELETEIRYRNNQGVDNTTVSEYEQPFSTFNSTLKLGFNF